FASKYQFVGDSYDFNTALRASILGLSSVNADTLFTQQTVGGSVTLSGQLSLFTRKFEKISRFTRLQMSYSLTSSRITDPKRNTDSDPSNDIPVIYSQPSIVTSRVIPSIYYNTKNASLDPTSGKSLFLGVAVSGGVLGGDVNTWAPQLDFQYFKPVLKRRSEKPHVVAMRFKADHIRAFGERFNAQRGDTRPLSFINGIPIFERFFLGGEYDVRGYNIRSITPVVISQQYASTKGPIAAKVVQSDGTLGDYTGPLDPGVTPKMLFDAPLGNCFGVTGPDQRPGCNTQPVASLFQVIGGDTQLVYNLEYRVPIVSVLSVAAFADVGT